MTATTDRAAALEFLLSRINYERTPSVPYRERPLQLDRMRQLLKALGDPHRHYPIVHIAGTKGKGSTATMLAAILSHAGKKTGLYTSPHLVSLEERFSINGLPCDSNELLELIECVRPVVEQLDASCSDAGQKATFFEITTAMAFLHFARQKVDTAVIEVGLGGRLDSTNVCEPVVAVITTISFDHMLQLGNTLDAIAREKAGIIKPGIPVVTGVSATEPFAAIEEIANDRGSELFRIGREFAFSVRSQEGSTLTLSEPGVELRGVRLALRGDHQHLNAAVAWATINRLRNLGWQISDEACLSGFAQATCPARIEVLQGNPTVILDAAHNVASIGALIQTMNRQFSQRPRTLVFSTAKDKDIVGMLKQLLPEFDRVILTRFESNPRAMDPSELLRIAIPIVAQNPAQNAAIEVASNPQLAWEMCIAGLSPASTVVIAGSFFLAAEMKKQIEATSDPHPDGR